MLIVGTVTIHQDAGILITSVTDDQGMIALLHVDASTGDRTIFSVGGVGSGVSFDIPLGMAIANSGDVLVADRGLDSLISVDPITGDRSILSGPGVGVGEPFVDLAFISVVPIPEPSSGVLLLIGLLAQAALVAKRSFCRTLK